MKKPRILLFDIETAPNLAYVWTKYLEGSVIEFKEEWHMLSFAWKWLGEQTTHCLTMHNHLTDKHLVKALHSLFCKADVLVGHNGDSFDIKKSHARFLHYGLPPPPPLPSVDTKKVAKRYFNFNSNSLNDLGMSLGLGTKVKHSGFDLWKGCMANKASSFREMSRYNKQDVVLLEKLYNKMLPWMQNHPSVSMFKDGADGCPTCGSKRVISNGFRVTNAKRYRRLQCQDCGNWRKGKAI